jgi:hypothetical protein
MRENWLLLWRPEEGVNTARPLLVVLEKRPEEVALVDDGFGGRAVELRFAAAGARIVVIRPFDRHVGDELDPTEIDRARLWSRALLKYPVGYREELAFDGACRATLTYEYLEIEDDWKTKPESLAPLPMLFSYALENRWPGARIEGNDKEVVDLGCKANSLYYIRSDCGAYRAAIGKSDVSYAFDRRASTSRAPAPSARSAGSAARCMSRCGSGASTWSGPRSASRRPRRTRSRPRSPGLTRCSNPRRSIT